MILPVRPHGDDQVEGTGLTWRELLKHTQGERDAAVEKWHATLLRAEQAEQERDTFKARAFTAEDSLAVMVDERARLSAEYLNHVKELEAVEAQLTQATQARAALLLYAQHKSTCQIQGYSAEHIAYLKQTGMYGPDGPKCTCGLAEQL